MKPADCLTTPPRGCRRSSCRPVREKWKSWRNTTTNCRERTTQFRLPRQCISPSRSHLIGCFLSHKTQMEKYKGQSDSLRQKCIGLETQLTILRKVRHIITCGLSDIVHRMSWVCVPPEAACFSFKMTVLGKFCRHGYQYPLLSNRHWAVSVLRSFNPQETEKKTI